MWTLGRTDLDTTDVGIDLVVQAPTAISSPAVIRLFTRLFPQAIHEWAEGRSSSYPLSQYPLVGYWDIGYWDTANNAVFMGIAGVFA